ncbi:hypothetical protein ACPF8X_44675, partial [Streptomyces sp. G35A]
GAAAGRLLPGVDDVLTYDAPWVGLEPPPVTRPATRRLMRTLTAGRFDRALVLVSYHQSPLPVALLLKLAGVGWIAADSEDYPGALLELRHRRRPGRHEARAALDLARAAGFALPPGDDEDLLVGLLDEVIFRLDTEGTLPLDCDVRPTGDGGLRVRWRSTSTDAVELVGAVPKAVSLHAL